VKNSQLLLAAGYRTTGYLSPRWLGMQAGMVFMVAISSLAAWQTIAFWTYPVNVWPLVLLSLVSFFVAAEICSRLRMLPRAEGIGLILLAVAGAFLAVVAVVALGRFYYSRSYLLACAIFTSLWLESFYLLRLSSDRIILAVAPGGMSTELLGLPGISWKPLTQPEKPDGCQGVVVDLHQKLSASWVRFLADCTLARMPIYHAAVLYESVTGKVSLSHLSEGFPAEFRPKPFYSLLKRSLDLALVLVTLPIILPLAGLVALAIRLDSPGPVLFRQLRVGEGGVPFTMLKFRSMTTGAEDGGAQFASHGDRRITGVGKLLRRFRLDELPQFWNIFKGEMSLVGPRPEQLAFAEEFEKEIPFYSYRNMVKPGITGWAQVCQGYAAGLNETRSKLGYDLYYIKHLSFWLDLWISLKTLRIVVSGYGVR